MEATKTIFASVSIPDLKKGNRVHRTLSFRGIQHQEEENTILRRAMVVRCSVPDRIVISVVELTEEREDRALMPASAVVREGTWLRTTHIKEVKMEVIPPRSNP